METSSVLTLSAKLMIAVCTLQLMILAVLVYFVFDMGLISQSKINASAQTLSFSSNDYKQPYYNDQAASCHKELNKKTLLGSEHANLLSNIIQQNLAEYFNENKVVINKANQALIDSLLDNSKGDNSKGDNSKSDNNKGDKWLADELLGQINDWVITGYIKQENLEELYQKFSFLNQQQRKLITQQIAQSVNSGQVELLN